MVFNLNLSYMLDSIYIAIELEPHKIVLCIQYVYQFKDLEGHHGAPAVYRQRIGGLPED